MYNPKIFQSSDSDLARELIQCHPFASLIVVDGGELEISHIPVEFVAGDESPARLIGHVARQNPMARAIERGLSATCIFHGPHGYISPSWYVDPLNVPTWNYAVVHVQGRLQKITEPAALEGLLEQLVARHETELGTGWTYSLPEEFRRDLMKAIVGFTLEIETINAKFKMSQNRDAADQAGAVAGVEKFHATSSPDLVAMMKAFHHERARPKSD